MLTNERFSAVNDSFGSNWRPFIKALRRHVFKPIVKFVCQNIIVMFVYLKNMLRLCFRTFFVSLFVISVLIHM